MKKVIIFLLGDIKIEETFVIKTVFAFSSNGFDSVCFNRDIYASYGRTFRFLQYRRD